MNKQINEITDLKTWYFTFGVGDEINGKNYVELDGTCDETREIMFKHFGAKWAFQYRDTSFLFDGQGKKRGLKLLTIDDLNSMRIKG